MADNDLTVKIGFDDSELQAGLGNASRELQTFEQTANGAGEGTKKLEGALDGAKDALDTVGKNAKGAASETVVLQGGFKGVGTAATAAGTSMKTALISTGIGALIVLVGELISHWSDVKEAVFGVNKELKEQQDIIETNLGLRSAYLGAIQEQLKLARLNGSETGKLEAEERKLISLQIEKNKQKEANLKLQKEELLAAYKTVSTLEGVGEAFGISPFSKDDAKAIDDLTKQINIAATATARLEGELFKVSNYDFPEVNLGTVKIKEGIQQVRDELAKPILTEGQGLAALPLQIKTAFDGIPIIITDATVKMRLALKFASDQLNSFNEEADRLIQNSITNTFAQLGNAIGQAIAQGTNVFDAAGKALLMGLANFLSSLGQMMIKYGVAAVAYSIASKALLNPLTALPAGAALIAAGAALSVISGAIRGAVSSGGGSGSRRSDSYNSSLPSQSGSGTSFTTNASTGSTVIFELAGTKLIGVIKNTLARDRAMGGTLTIP